MGDSHRSSRKHKHRDKDQPESSSSSRRHRDQPESSSSRRHRDNTDSASRVSRRAGVSNDDLLQPQSAAGGFAATRQEIEFGFDDGASSMWDQGTDYGSVYQQQQQQQPQPQQQAAGSPIPAALRDVWQARNFYELLCLAPNAPAAEVRRAYYRYFTLLHPDAHPAKARQVAHIYWAIVQEAFETLSNPQKRLVYERDCLGEPDQDSDLPLSVSPFRTLEATADRARLNLDHSLDTFDFSLRVDAEGLVRALQDGSEPSPSMLKPVDFFTSHSFTVPLPGLGRNLDMVYLLYTPHHLLDSEPRIVLTGDGSEKESAPLADEEDPGLQFYRPDPPG
ncbi:hypothetical protein PG994_009262 [Apiospora phragmitis]|uniref:J domain-containing protein n=1 Tax=Apiospora phragmitis TaxID=2905665 RepID=A0ABR1UIS8_9PEZI